MRHNSRTELVMFELPEDSEHIRFSYYGAQVDMNITRLGKLLNIDLTIHLQEEKYSEGSFVTIWIGGDYSRGPTASWNLTNEDMLRYSGIVPTSEKIGLYLHF